jgi:polyisoprenoid-binding protein YceI
MKNLMMTAAAAAMTVSAATAGVKPEAAASFKVDVKKSRLEWFAEKVTGKHNGTIDISSGEIKVSKGKIVSGNFEINMNSMTATDLEGEWKDKLNGHLKSEDFFSVEKFPKARFEITSVAPIKDAKEGQPNYNVKGNLTIKGITQEIVFRSLITMTKDGLTASGEAVIDRSKYDIRYGSKSFFGDLGDKMIYDEFTVKLNIVAEKMVQP